MTHRLDLYKNLLLGNVDGFGLLILAGHFSSFHCKSFQITIWYFNFVKFVSLTHKLVAVGRCSGIVGCIEQSMKLDQFDNNVTSSQYNVLSLTTGYLIYDTIICLYNGDEVMYVIHHTLSLFMVVIPIVTRKNGAELIFSLWHCGFSEPFLHFT